MTPLTTLDPSRRESSHRWPHFLPDGRHVLYYARSALPENAGIYVVSVESKKTTRLLSVPSNVAYAPPGYLLFDRDGTLVAQPFDARELRITGEPFAVATEILYDAGPFRTDFAVSDSGILAYRSVAGASTQVVWVDRTGKQLGVVAASDYAFNLSLSRDDQRLALSRLVSKRGLRDIWLYDLLRGTNSRFTFDPATEIQPVWSPDGSRLVFSSDREGAYDLHQKLTSGGGREELLLHTSESKWANDWSLDGRYIAYEADDPRTGLDLWGCRSARSSRLCRSCARKRMKREVGSPPIGVGWPTRRTRPGDTSCTSRPSRPRAPSGRSRRAVATILIGGGTGRSCATSASTAR